MRIPHRTGLLILLLATGCRDTRELSYSRVRLQQIPVSNQVVRLSKGGGAPSVSLTGPQGVVFWENAGTEGLLSIVVEAKLALGCPRTIGFAAQGERSFTDRAIPPGGFATLCLYHPGEYAYEVWFDGAQVASGTVSMTGAGS